MATLVVMWTSVQLALTTALIMLDVMTLRGDSPAAVIKDSLINQDLAFREFSVLVCHDIQVTLLLGKKRLNHYSSVVCGICRMSCYMIHLLYDR